MYKRKYKKCKGIKTTLNNHVNLLHVVLMPGTLQSYEQQRLRSQIFLNVVKFETPENTIFNIYNNKEKHLKVKPGICV